MSEKNIIISIDNLSKYYNDGKIKAVDGISFDVKKGELFAFLGVNGAGKSTTINVLCTLLRKTGGDVKVCGFDVEKEADKVKESIGVVFQNGVLDGKLTVYDNLVIRAGLFGIEKETARKKIENLANRLKMEDFLNRRYEKLSGGQKRKSDIARALVSEPKILFLDEPTTGLDPQSRIDMWKVIKEIRDEFNTTIFLTTHYMEEVNVADTVAIIDNGKLLCVDSPEKLKSKYSEDTVKLTVEEIFTAKLTEKLENLKLNFSFSVDTFVIHIKSSLDIIDFISEIKPMLSGIEIIKGDMDSVFLNVVGGGGIIE
jgi:multidrug/hemolysin transport system ATP-binding protein